jgi:hypothetical protein
MRKVKLKEKSPEFDEERMKSSPHQCEISGCDQAGDYRAPKSRNLDDYYRFCKDHVSDYNRAWNFFDGMNDKDIQDHMYESLFGNRPTWKFTGNIDLEDELRRQAGTFYDDAAKEREKRAEEKRNRQIATDTPEGEALEIMGLSAPITLDEIKIKYKELAKKWHPDVNRNDPEAEEKLKDINMAYTVLRLAYQKFESQAEKFE